MNYFWTEGFSSVLLNFQAQRFLLLFPVFYWMLKFTCLIIRGRVLYILNFDSYQKLLFILENGQLFVNVQCVFK